MLCRALQGAIVLQAISYVWGADGISFGVSDEVLGFAGRRIGQGDPFALLEPIKQGLRKIRGASGQASVKTLPFGTVGALSPLP